jgi:hypothetical protein
LFSQLLVLIVWGVLNADSELSPKSANNYMNVVISPNIRKTTARIDINGNVLNRQGQAIEPLETPYIPTKEELAGPAITGKQVEVPIGTSLGVPSSPLTIQQQIDEAKANLAKLEELKKLKIAEMEAQLELLKQ